MDNPDRTKDQLQMEATYASIFNAANDAIFIHDIETLQIIDVNDKTCEMFCYPKEELIKMSVADISLGEKPYTMESALERARKAASGEPQLFEWMAKDKAGRSFWIEVNLKRAVIAGRYRLLATVRDISDRKQTEDRLNKINETFLNFGVDPAGNIERLTGLCGELLGADCALYNRLIDNELHSCGQWNVPSDFKLTDKADGHICYDVIRQDRNEASVIRNLKDSRYAASDPNIMKYDLQTYIGQPVRFGASCVGTLCVLYKRDYDPTDEDRKVISIIASAIGIEEERKSVSDESLLAQFSIEHAADPVFWINRDSDILYVNDRASQGLGYSRDELLKMKISDIDPEFPPEKWPYHWAELKERHSFTFESKHRKKDGTLFPVEVTVNFLEFHGEEYNFAFARDITERKKQEKDLLKRDYQLEILSRTSQHINTFLDIPLIMRALISGAVELSDALGGTAGIVKGGRMVFKEYSKNGKFEPIDYSFDLERGLSSVMSKTMKPYLSNDAEHDEHILPEKQKRFNLHNIISVPIFGSKNDLLACLEVYNKAENMPFDTQDAYVLQGLAASGAIALENAKMFLELKQAHKDLASLNEELIKSNKKLNKLVLKDTQTGLYNHHFLIDVIEAEFYRARRYGHQLAVVMLDIDYFKSINDVYGHEYGDMVLKQFAAHLKSMVRRYDMVVRFGGEEFVILSPGVDRNKAFMMAQRLLDAINLYNFGDKKHVVKLKLSAAVVSYPDEKISKGIDLVSISEKILLKAKQAGGNRVYSSLDLEKQKSVLGQDMDSSDVRILKEKIEVLNRRGKENLVESIFALAKTIELKDHYTGEHVERTVYYSTEIARALNLPPEDIENIRQASILHDLGKIGISDRILFKKGKLTKKEFEEIRKHPQIAADIIRPIQFMHDIIPLVLYHHEHWDGKGYPAGIKAEEIPIGARIIAVSDVYQALTSNRPYRRAFSEKKAIDIIKEGSGSQFDPQIVKVFLEVIKKNSKRKSRKWRKT